MDFNSIKFSKLFTDKHGGEVFDFNSNIFAISAIFMVLLFNIIEIIFCCVSVKSIGGLISELIGGLIGGLIDESCDFVININVVLFGLKDSFISGAIQPFSFQEELIIICIYFCLVTHLFVFLYY